LRASAVAWLPALSTPVVGGPVIPCTMVNVVAGTELLVMVIRYFVTFVQLTGILAVRKVTVG
jgi:hypothetical protein